MEWQQEGTYIIHFNFYTYTTLFIYIYICGIYCCTITSTFNSKLILLASTHVSLGWVDLTETYIVTLAVIHKLHIILYPPESNQSSFAV